MNEWMNEWMNEFRDTMDWNGLRFDTPRVDYVVYVAKMASVFPAQEREIKVQNAEFSNFI